MATYVMSDIHGEYDLFAELLDTIGLKEADTLYILGDILDRGPHPVKTLLKIMEMPNVFCLVGNHEFMALKCLRFLTRTITDELIADLDQEKLEAFLSWQRNGCDTTLEEFGRLDAEMRQEVMDYLMDLLLYEELTAGGKHYLLVHGGLGNYRPDKEISEYTLKELVWDRADYETRYFEDTYVVSGHTPTQFIEGNPRPGYVYRKNNHIAIDCGCYLPGGRLAAMCLETGEEFYSSAHPL